MDGQSLNTEIPANCVAISKAAKEVRMTPVGFLDFLKRTNSAIRRDGRYFVTSERLAKIKEARIVFGKMDSADQVSAA